MADGDFSLVSKTGDVISLNPLLTSNEGVQAVAGLTGFGLPPVEVLYQVGAGDGAKFRGQRSLPRDIDLPLYITGPTRAALRTQVNRLAAALNDECGLRWDDGDRVWELKVRRVGGGEYVYGTDTDATGIHMTITLRSESALWSAVEETFTHYPITTDSATKLNFPASTFGSAASRPLIRVAGPTFGFIIENRDKTKRLEFRGLVPENDYIDIDMDNGTVTNKAGDNVYAYLAPGPGFFPLGPGADYVWVTLDRTSDEFIEIKGLPLATNYLTNPTFKNDANGWSLQKYYNVGSMSSVIARDGESILFKRYEFGLDQGDHGPLAWLDAMPIPLEVGKRYQVTVQLSDIELMWPEPYPMLGNMPGLVKIEGPGYGHTINFEPNGTTTRELRFDFVARGTEARIQISPPTQFLDFGGHARQVQTRVNAVSFSEYGYPYFDGDTPDTPERSYEWLGTPHASRSRILSASSTLPTPDLPQGAGVYVQTNAKNWLVV